MHYFTLDGTGLVINQLHRDGLRVHPRLCIHHRDLYTPTVDWSQNGDDFGFNFDSANISGSKVQVTVNVSASDLAGNPSTGASLVLFLDNHPPIVDLDAGNVRVRKLSGQTQLCSESFDPLGTLAANDLESITPFKHFRAMVWEQTNFTLPPAFPDTILALP